MARDISAAAIAAAAAPVVRPFMLLAMDFSSGFVRVNSTDRDLVWDGDTYQGVGGLGRVGAADEGAELQAYGISFELSGIRPEYIAIALGEHYQGRAVTLYQGFLDADYLIVVDPFIIFRGRMDQMQASLGATGTIAVTAESRLIDWERPRIRRFTDADQQAAFAGDRGLEFVTQMASRELIWGRS